MNVLINSKKFLSAFMNITDKEIELLKTDKVKLDYVKKTLDLISKRLLLPDLKEEDLNNAINLLNKLSEKSDLKDKSKPKFRK